MSASVNIKNNVGEIIKSTDDKIEKTLIEWGLIAERHAKENCPVDTGRLRNSITYATATTQGNPNTNSGEKAQSNDYQMRERPDKNTVGVGTNVAYAPKMEFEEMYHKLGKAHYLRDAVLSHIDEYKGVAEKNLR